MTGPTARMLLVLLLPLFISFHQTSSAGICRSSRDFEVNVDAIGDLVKNCSKNCSSTHSDRRCTCMNLNMSRKAECFFPNYFVQGLELLKPTISDQVIVTDLIKSLKTMARTCESKINFCSLSITYKAFISLRDLHEQLTELKQQVNTIIYSTN